MPDHYITKKLPKNSGLLPNPFDPRDVWVDEILAGNQKPIPDEYCLEGLVFEPQGAHPYCVSFAVTKMLEFHYKKQNHPYEASQPHLFYRSGGTYNGSYFRSNLQTAKEFGAIPFERMPMPHDVWDFDQNVYRNYKIVSENISFDEALKIGGYARVQTNREQLQRAVMSHGPIMVGVDASNERNNSYWDSDHKRIHTKDNHAVLLVGWTKDHWILFDSLQPHQIFDGYHFVDRSYPFYSAYAVVELPSDWKEKRDRARAENFDHCLNHYGQPRNYEREVKVAAEMLAEFKKFNNQSVMEAAGRFWTVLINMCTYGGYNISYHKWGKWMPGDVINMVYAWRRTGQLIFDPNKLRSEYP